MSPLELKKQLINKIQITHDEDVLGGLLRLLEFESKVGIYKMNDEQKTAIKIANEQIQLGDFYTEKEADKITDEWLNK